MKTDIFGTLVGTLVYLSLTPSLAALGRPDLVVAALACALLNLWPLAFSRLAPGFYTRHRDHMLIVQ